MLRPTVVVTPASGQAFDVTEFISNLRFSSLVPGGFGSCSFNVDTNELKDWLGKLPKLSEVRVTDGSEVLWDGRLEDHAIRIGNNNTQLGVSAFGNQRLLTDHSFRRIWIMKNIPWTPVPGLSGNLTAQALSYQPQHINSISIGNFDETDLTRIGIKFKATSSAAVPDGTANGVWWLLDDDEPEFWFLGIKTDGVSDTSITRLGVRTSVDGVTWTTKLDVAGSDPAVLNVVVLADLTTLTATARYLQVIFCYDSPAATANGEATFEDITLVGVPITFDTGVGYYGGTILEDCVDQTPGLIAGNIESGSDFVVQELHRVQRATIRSVVDEVAAYYLAEWGVWEDSRFDWVTPRLDEKQWTVASGDCVGIDLDFVVEGMARTTYVSYTNVATSLQTEESATSTSEANPFAKLGRDRDQLIQLGFPSTAIAAQRIADLLAYLDNEYPSVTGRIVLPCDLQIHHAQRGQGPASRIRAGDNISIPDLPKSRLFLDGRDGETQMHIVSCDVDIDANTVTLAVERGLSRAAALLTRLALVTQFASSVGGGAGASPGGGGGGGGGGAIGGTPIDSPGGDGPSGPEPPGPIYDPPVTDYPLQNPLPGGAPVPY